MAVDFSPILLLLTSLLPIILMFVVIGAIIGVVAGLGKFGQYLPRSITNLVQRRKLYMFLFVFILLFFLIAGFLAPTVGATASMTPSTGVLIVGFPSPFTTDGLTASTAHHVNVTVGSTTTTAITSLTTNADGELSFSLVFTKAGSTTVEVSEGAVGAGTVKASGQFDVQDMLANIMLYVVFILQVVVIFMVVGLVVGLFAKLK